MEWPRLLQMNWPSVPWMRTDQDLIDAGSEIKAVMGRNAANNEELCTGLRWLAGPEGKQEKAPSLREVIRAVYIVRKESQAQNAPPADDCACCRGTGWATVAPEPHFPLYRCQVPCLCDAGAARYDKADDYAHLRKDPQGAQAGAFRRLRDLAVDQWRERARAEAGAA